MKKTFLIFCVFAVFPGFALDCQNADEKLVLLNGAKIGDTKYNKPVLSDKLKTCDSLFNCSDLYDGGEWAVKNDKSDDFNVSGVSGCFDGDAYQIDLDNKKKGAYCWCKTKIVDNYKVLSKWRFAKVFDQNLKDYNKKHRRDKNDETSEDYEKTLAVVKDQKECMKSCSEFCAKSKTVEGVEGFYVCDNAKYKVKNVNCIVNKYFLTVQEIKIFEDVAEIVTKSDNIVLTKDSDSSWYVGKYNYDNPQVLIKTNR